MCIRAAPLLAAIMHDYDYYECRPGLLFREIIDSDPQLDWTDQEGCPSEASLQKIFSFEPAKQTEMWY